MPTRALPALLTLLIAGCAASSGVLGPRDDTPARADAAPQASAGTGRGTDAGVAADAGTSARDCGRIRIDGRHFRCADGSVFVPVGENRINIYDATWNWKELSTAEYVRYVASHGINVLRVFVVTDVENEERGGVNPGVLEPELGRFDESVAREFDVLFRAAERHGVYVVLVPFALGFSPDDDWKSWKDNPYSAERGGPAATRYDFFESAEVRALAARRLRYIAERYGSSPRLLAIDLLNEPEWDGEIPEVSWAAWAREMARVWDDADPHDRPVTVGSVGLHWNVEGDEREWWASEACDVVQWHLYGREVYDVHALAAEMTRKVEETWHYGKPVLVGEFAYGGEAKPEYDHTHVGLWSAAFSGAGVLAHSAPAFNVDSDELMTPERARHWRVLREVLDSLGAAEPRTAVATGGSRAWRLDGENATAVWLMAPPVGYGQPLEGVRVTLEGMADGTWNAEWRDDVDGSDLHREPVVATGGAVVLAAPTFARHVVVRLERADER